MTHDPRIEALLRAHARSDAPGLVVAVRHDGRVVHRAAYGMASLEHGVALTPASRMPIASASKPFTAVAVLRLAERGVLDLDAGVRRWLPELPALDGEPTLRQLLTHMGGLRCYLDAEFASGYALRPRGAALEFQLAQTAADFAPGTEQVYTNSGYHLLSLVLERATGQTFETVMETEVFEPLGMAFTRSVRDDEAVHIGHASLYEPTEAGGYRPGVHVAAERLGDGAVWSTADDLLRWLAELRAPDALLSSEAHRLMTMPTALPDGLPSGYGAGLQVREHRGVRAWGHGGALIGARAQVMTLPDHALDVVVLANSTTAAEPLAWAVAEAVLGGDVLASVPPAPSAADHPALLGTWRSEATGRVYTFRNDDGELRLSALGGPAAPLASEAAQPDGLLPFSAPAPVGRVRFAYRQNHLVVHGGGRAIDFARVNGTAALDALASEAAGSYACDDVGARLTLRRDELVGEWLVETRGPHGRSVLRPVCAIGPDMLATAKLDLFPFPAVLALVRDGAGRVSGLEVTTARTRRLPFRRVESPA